MVKNDKIIFDIMIGGMFYATERMPLDKNVVIEKCGDEYKLDVEKVMDWVEKRRPTLKRGKYEICF